MDERIKNVLMDKLAGYKIKIPSEAFEMMLLIVSESDKVPQIDEFGSKDQSFRNEKKFYSSVSNTPESMKALPEEFSREDFYETVKEILENSKKESEVHEKEHNIFYVKSEQVVIAVVISEMYMYCKDILRYVFEELSKIRGKCTDITELYTRIKNGDIDFLREMWLFKRKYANHMVKIYGLPDVDLLINLSSCLYEGAQNESILFIADDSADSYWEKVEEFGGEDATRKLVSGNRRSIRKLMEISGKGKVQLLATKNENGMVVTHLVKCSGEDMLHKCYIMFKGFLHWSVFVGGREILSYYQGSYEVNFDEKDKVYKKIQTIKENDTDMDEDMLTKLVNVLKKQKHGTSAILIKDKTFAEDEVGRLCGVKRGTVLSQGTHYKKEWDESTMLGLTAIDGALIMDWSGKCLAMGVIVDGVVLNEGNIERGARYNSIKNYIEINAQKSCMIGIIVSEDGMVDVIYSEDKYEKVRSGE